MIDKILKQISKSKINKFKFEKFLEEIPNDFFIENYDVKRSEINSSIMVLSSIISIVLSFGVFFYDFFFGLLILIITFLVSTLFIIRKIRKNYLNKKIEVEQYSDFICREILLILSTTKSISSIIEYLSRGMYPIISPMLKQSVKRMNLGASPIELLEDFAEKQPSETLKEFIHDIIIPIGIGRIDINRKIDFEAQWRIRQSFEAYLSQLEGKTSIFLAITTIIPLTVSMMLVILGYLSINLILFLPVLFLVFDLIAVEIYNTGKIELLGGR
ncbi:MAG: hypothetical protein EAX90_01110 [Candidatus Heimdallarchaeota archaeon]|nr:hypothetical protein [Candidatus Heimdallarchaeota archaeon]